MAQSSFAFNGKVALVTGASRGIGLAIARELVSGGASVCLTARDQASLDEAVYELGVGNRAIGVAGGSDDEQHQNETVHRTLTSFGRLDFLVNNAGVNPTYGPMVDLSASAARKIFEVNCLAALSWTQLVHRAWMAEHGGAIVNVASIAALRPARGVGFYGASKAMLAHMTEQLAVELGPKVRVNAVAPGVIKTSFALALYEGREDAVAEPYPLKRLGDPHDVSDLVSFLLSEKAKWITGQIVVVDGGAMLV